MKVKVYTLLGVGLLLCASCLGKPAPAPTSLPTQTPSPTPQPKVLTVCMPEEPDTLYWYDATALSAHHIWQAIYDGPIDNRTYAHQSVLLIELPSLDAGSAAIETVSATAGQPVVAVDGAVVPLAPGVVVADAAGQRVTFEEAPVVMPQMVVTFTLRPGIRWSDGEPLTADDSVFSFELAADPATPGERYSVDHTAEYRATDIQTVVWRGLPGFIDHFYYLNFWHPLPRHAWGMLSPSDLLTAQVSARKPLGWGAFALQEWVPGDHITVVRNPYYFQASAGLPRVDVVQFRFIADAVRLGEELRAGRCDVVTHEAADGVLAALPEESAEVRTVSTYDARWELLAFGISPALGYDRPDFFEDVRVRQAIARCIDRERIAAQVAGPMGRVSHSFLPPSHPLYAGDALTIWEHDGAAGQQLLAEAGWYDEDGDGVRESHTIPGIADGTPFTVTYHTTRTPGHLQIAELIQADLKACGIQVDLAPLSGDEMFVVGAEGVLFGRRFDLAQFSWRAVPDPACDLFLSEQMPTPGGWGRPNVVGFLDDAYDMACLSALGALPGSAAYASGQIEAQRIFSERLPALPLFQHTKVTLARPGVIGLAPNPTQASELWNLEQLDIR